MSDMYSGPELAGYVVGTIIGWAVVCSPLVFIFLTWLNSRKIWRKMNKR